MPINKLQVAPAEPIETHVVLAIDSSGSMASRAKPAVQTVNSIVDTLKTEAQKLGQKVVVTIMSFGESVDTLVDNVDVSRVKPLRQSDYSADGGTPLFEATHKAIVALNRNRNPEVAKVLTVITDGAPTDGSSEFYRIVRDTLPNLRAKDEFTVTFSVPRGNAPQTLYNIPGLLPSNVVEWDTTEAGMEEASNVNSAGYANFLALRSTGAKSSTAFYANIDPQKAKKVKKNLTDVQKDFKSMNVRTQDPKTIQDFIESRGLTFAKGRAFYQLTKPETVQNHKNILMKELATGKVYGGADARSILGLPDYTDVKLRPTDHSEWEIYVQSTSNNRKLMAGTNLLYLK